MRTVIGIRVKKKGKSWIKYWNARKQLDYTSRSGLNLLETKSGSNLNANILPSCGLIDATNYSYISVASTWGAVASGAITVRFYYDGSSNQIYLFSSSKAAGSVQYFFLDVAAGKPRIVVRNASPAFNNAIAAANAIAAGWHTIKFESTGSAYNIYVDNMVAPVALTVVAGLNDGKWLSSVTQRDRVTCGCTMISSAVQATTIAYIDYIQFDTTNKWIFTGVGLYTYDIIGANPMMWVGAAHVNYNSSGGSYLLDTGYSVWIKAEAADEYVPYASANTPLDPSAYLTGYAKSKDYAGNLAAFNMAPSLVGFNETSSADTKLAIFDRSNTDRASDASRASSYYSATSLATKSRFHSSEISNYLTMRSFFNAGYKHKIFPVQNAAIKTSITEIAVTDTDFTGNNLQNALDYCNIKGFIAFGDSITSGPSATTRYSYLVATDKSIEEINKGVPSDAVQIELIARIGDLAAYAENSRIFILCGINDIDHLVNDSPQGTDELFVSSYESIIDSLVSYGYVKANIYISTLTWLNGDSYGYLEHVVPYNTLISGIASRKGVNLIDLYTATLNHTEYFTGAEELHPNATGHQAMANQIISDINWWT